MILLDFFTSDRGHELGIDQITFCADVRDSGGKTATSAHRQCLQRCDGVPRQHPFQNQIRLATAGLAVLVDVLHKA